MKPSVPRLVSSALAVGLILSAGAVAAQSRLSVQIDHSERVQLPGAAGSVIVGNPAIADVTVVDSNTLFITGKGYGVTEIIAVDTIGRTVFQSQVVVTGGTAGSVRVWRGANVSEMACSSSCAVSVRSNGSATPTP